MNVARGLAITLAGALALACQPARAGLIGNGTNTANALFFFGTHTVAGQEIEDFFNGATDVAGPAPIGPSGVKFVEGPVDLSTIQVGDTQITITNLAPSSMPFCSGTLPCTDSFTGFEFQFTGAVDITGVSVDPASAAAFVPVAGGLSFTATDIQVNVAGDAPAPGDTLVLDLTFPRITPPPIPEPASLLLLGSALLGIAATHRGRLRRSIFRACREGNQHA
jgi:hypothetical protein